MKKLSILIALVCLSFGAFAQVSTTVNFKKMPTYPAGSGRLHDARVVCEWHMSTNETRTNYAYSQYMYEGGWLQVMFPGTVEEAALVTSTTVYLYFYEDYTGTGKTFPKFPAIVECDTDFKAVAWWKILGPGGGENVRSVGGSYTYEIVYTEP